MKGIIRSELYRLSKAKEVWAMAICLVGLQVASWVSYLIAVRRQAFGEDTAEFFGSGFFDSFPKSTEGIAFRLLFVIMVASLVTKLYQTGVMKQLVSCGVSRKNMIVGQLIAFTIVFSVLALISSVAAGLNGVLCGGSFTLTEGNWGRWLLAFLSMFLVIACMCSIHLFVAHLTASMGAAIAVGLVAEVGVPSALSSLGFYLGNETISKFSFDTLQNAAVNYINDYATMKEQCLGILGTAIYMVVLTVLTVAVVKRREIK